MNIPTHDAPALAAGGGLFDWATTAVGDFNELVAQVAVVVVVLFVVIAAVKSKMSMAAILIAILVGGLVLWAVNNPTAVPEQMGPDLPGAMSVTRSLTEPPV
jgi:hypothetical protein